MVQELLEKLHAASKQLKERDHAISRLRQETVVLTRELDAPERNGGDQPSLASLSFFGSPVPSRSGRRPSGGGPAKPLGPEKLPSPLGPPKGTIARTREMRAARPRSQTAASTAFRAGRCPACGHELRKAKCVNVITQLCLRCRGIFIDQRSIRHLARSQNWFRSVERFLSGPAAVTASAQKTGRLSRSRVR
jgi:Zn-finger nucleic acid-binding protein